MRTLAQWREFAKQMKQKIVVAGLLVRKPGVPWLAKLVLVLAVAYALSPIDLIPDFIPMLGALDDLILVPLMIWLAFKLVPEALIQQAEVEAAQIVATTKQVVGWGALIVVLIWAGLAYAAYRIWFMS